MMDSAGNPVLNVQRDAESNGIWYTRSAKRAVRQRELTPSTTGQPTHPTTSARERRLGEAAVMAVSPPSARLYKNVESGLADCHLLTPQYHSPAGAGVGPDPRPARGSPWLLPRTPRLGHRR